MLQQNLIYFINEIIIIQGLIFKYFVQTFIGLASIPYFANEKISKVTKM